MECASAPVASGMTTIDGDAVIAIVCYANTLPATLTPPQRAAVIGKAFDIYAAAVRREQT